MLVLLFVQVLHGCSPSHLIILITHVSGTHRRRDATKSIILKSITTSCKRTTNGFVACKKIGICTISKHVLQSVSLDVSLTLASTLLPKTHIVRTYTVSSCLLSKNGLIYNETIQSSYYTFGCCPLSIYGCAWRGVLFLLTGLTINQSIRISRHRYSSCTTGNTIITIVHYIISRCIILFLRYDM